MFEFFVGKVPWVVQSVENIYRQTASKKVDKLLGFLNFQLWLAIQNYRSILVYKYPCLGFLFRNWEKVSRSTAAVNVSFVSKI